MSSESSLLMRKDKGSIYLIWYKQPEKNGKYLVLFQVL